LIGKVVLLVSPQSGKKRITIKSDFDKNIKEIYLDSDKIKQAILNIITNAIDFTPVGGTIRVVTKNFPSQRNPSSIRIWISDNGPGIPPEIIDKVFDPYFTTKRHGNMRNGTGLGLFIAYRDLQDHGGTLEVQSEENSGATFIFTLPYRSHPEKRAADGKKKNAY
jgi:signal transduction histidine kinase